MTKLTQEIAIKGKVVPSLFTRLGIESFQLTEADIADPMLVGFANYIVGVDKLNANHSAEFEAQMGAVETKEVVKSITLDIIKVLDQGDIERARRMLVEVSEQIEHN